MVLCDDPCGGRVSGGVEGERQARVRFHEARERSARENWEYTNQMRLAGIQKVRKFRAHNYTTITIVTQLLS